MSTIKGSYVHDSPFVEAAIDLISKATTKFSFFGTIEEQTQRVFFKPEWPRDARVLFEHGAIMAGHLIENKVTSPGQSNRFEFRIDFKPQMRTWKTATVPVTPTLTIRLESEDELRQAAEDIREQRKARKELKAIVPDPGISTPGTTL